jgi:hypothetical protein
VLLLASNFIMTSVLFIYKNIYLQAKSSLPILLEDPVRRRYKLLLASSFIMTSSLYLLVDTVFHIQSAVTESWLAHRWPSFIILDTILQAKFVLLIIC